MKESEQLNMGIRNPYIKRLTFRKLVERVQTLEKRIEELESKKKKSTKNEEVKENA